MEIKPEYRIIMPEYCTRRSGLKAKADDKGKVVAEASMVTVAIIGTEGLDSSILFVFFKEEGSIVDVGLGNGITEGRTD